MPIDPNQYDVALGHSLADRLAFRMEHWLLSPGTSDVGRLRGYLLVKTWRDCTSVRERLHLLKAAAKFAPRAARDAVEAVRKYGDHVTREYGISRQRQVAQLWWIRLRHGTLPPTYYIFRLFRPGQLRRAPNFFQENEGDEVFRLLNVRTALDEANLLLDKSRFEEWLVDHGFPTARSLLEFGDGTIIRTTVRETGLPHRDLFSKPNDALQGLGTEKWRYDSGVWVAEDGRRWTERALLSELSERSRGGGILLQEQLRNHPALAPLAPGTLSTVRILTLRSLDGAIRVIMAASKIPTGTAATDHMRLGGVAAPIDLDTGRLGPGIRKSTETFIAPCARHPDTGALIEGFQIPLWDSAKQLAVRAHEALDRIVCVGWDVAILEDGPVIIEGNDNPGHTSSQWPTGVALGETEVVPTVLAHLERAFENATWRGAGRTRDGATQRTPLDVSVRAVS
jgi:hypothetical protein